MWCITLLLLGMASLPVSAFPYRSVGNTGFMDSMNVAMLTNSNDNANSGMKGAMSRGNEAMSVNFGTGPSTAELINEALGMATYANARKQASDTAISSSGTMFTANGRNSGTATSSMGLGLPMMYFPTSGVNIMAGNTLNMANGGNKLFEGMPVNMKGTEGQNVLNLAGNSFSYVPLGMNFINTNTGMNAAANANAINNAMNRNAFTGAMNSVAMNTAMLGNSRTNTMDGGNFDNRMNVAKQNANLRMTGAGMNSAAGIESLVMNAAIDTNNEISMMRNTGNGASPDSNLDNMRLVNMNINMGTTMPIDRRSSFTNDNEVQMINDANGSGTRNMNDRQTLVNADINKLTNRGVGMNAPVMQYTGQGPLMMNGMDTGSAFIQGPDCNLPGQANSGNGNAGSGAMNTLNADGSAFKKSSLYRWW